MTGRKPGNWTNRIMNSWKRLPVHTHTDQTLPLGMTRPGCRANYAPKPSTEHTAHTQCQCGRAGAAYTSGNHQCELNFGLHIDIAGRTMKCLTCPMSYNSALANKTRLHGDAWQDVLSSLGGQLLRSIPMQSCPIPEVTAGL